MQSQNPANIINKTIHRICCNIIRVSCIAKRVSYVKWRSHGNTAGAGISTIIIGNGYRISFTGTDKINTEVTVYRVIDFQRLHRSLTGILNIYPPDDIIIFITIHRVGITTLPGIIVTSVLENMRQGLMNGQFKLAGINRLSGSQAGHIKTDFGNDIPVSRNQIFCYGTANIEGNNKTITTSKTGQC